MRLNALIKVWAILVVTWLHWLQTTKYRAIDIATAAGVPPSVFSFMHAAASRQKKRAARGASLSSCWLVGWLVVVVIGREYYFFPDTRITLNGRLFPFDSHELRLQFEVCRGLS